MDTPVNSDDIESTEEADYVEEGEQLKPRQRSLPSYIKKEKPIISSESSEDDDDDDDDTGDKKSQRGKDDDDSFPDIPDEEDDDIPVLEALFDEDDEVIRPSLKRTQPRIRKAAESDGSESETSTGKFFQTRRIRIFGLPDPDPVIIPVLRIRIFFHHGSQIQGQKNPGSGIRIKECKYFNPKKFF